MAVLNCKRHEFTIDGKRNKYFYFIRFYAIKTRLRDRDKLDFSPNNIVA